MPGEARAEGPYEGARGAAYHARRSGARSEADQIQRAGYFSDLTTPEHTVLDFGCGTGGVLAALPAGRRIGVEVNPLAAAQACRVLDEVRPDLSDVGSESIDRVISFHALEHVPAPALVLADLKRVLKKGGRARLIVPFEDAVIDPFQRGWSPDDPDMHLYSWTPRSFANAITYAGLTPLTVGVAPFSGGGALARWLEGSPGLKQAAIWLKALRARRFQIIAEAQA